MEHKDERVVLETARYRISGLLRLPRDGYRSRLTDFLNAGERDFIALTDVDLTPLGGAGDAEHRNFIAVARSQIVLAAPVDDEADEAEANLT
ncbi:MAG TPA: hypothetical protein VG186_09925 [Solirubrobacteraceae bacterium]|nr:hypothetical protein [Solirubrobacteraceae bacterium]